MKTASAAATERAMTRRVGDRLTDGMLPPLSAASARLRRRAGRHTVAVVVAQGPRRLLGESVAVALAVGSPHEGRTTSRFHSEMSAASRQRSVRRRSMSSSRRSMRRVLCHGRNGRNRVGRHSLRFRPGGRMRKLRDGEQARTEILCRVRLAAGPDLPRVRRREGARRTLLRRVRRSARSGRRRRPAPRPEAPAAERRLVSVLFADLVGFAPLSESRDAEEVRGHRQSTPSTSVRRADLQGAEAILSATEWARDAEQADLTAAFCAAESTLLRAQGRAADAVAAAARGLAVRDELGIANSWVKRCLVEAVEGALELDDLERADELLHAVETVTPGELTPYLDGTALVSAHATRRGAAACALGRACGVARAAASLH